jgi:hypothetical protein
MEEELIKLHHAAGLACGRDSTCGAKVKYNSEERANIVAVKMSAKFQRNLEAYPCVFCNNWHIGRQMSLQEMTELTGGSNE